jgi:hypothetical protein
MVEWLLKSNVQLRYWLNISSIVSMGISILLSWTYILYKVELYCPCWETTLKFVIRALIPPLNYVGIIVWAILLSIPLIVNGRSWFIAIPPLTLILTIAISDPLPLALTSISLMLLSGLRRVFETISAGIIFVESTVLTYILARAYNLQIPLLPTLPIHLSLYTPLIPVMPILVLVACLSPILNPLATKKFNPINHGMSRTLLAIALITSLTMWSIIYYSALNPGLKLVGVDAITRYYPHALQLLKGGLQSVMSVGYDRPLYYLILYALAKYLGAYNAVRILALIAISTYTVASYIFAREVWGGGVAGIAAMIAPLTYTATVGFYSGLYSNWTSLSIALLAYTSIVKWLRRGGVKWLALYFILMAGSVATHVYMGAIFFAASTITLALATIEKNFRRKALTVLAIQIAFATLSLLAIENLGPQLGIPTTRTPIKIVISNVNLWLRGVANLKIFSTDWWNNMCFAIYAYAPTAALDPTVWILTAIGIATLKFKSLDGFIIMPWILIVAALSFTAPLNLIYRVLYDMPYSITEAVGISYITENMGRRFSGRVGAISLAALIAFKICYAMNYAVGLAS